MSNPNFNCGSCDEPKPVQFVEVPTCAGSEDSSLCQSQKGKFYDRIIEPFVVPTVGRTGRVYVCEGKLWAKCQWIGMCIGSEKIAAFQIVDVTNKYITVLNGCKTGEAILGNPEPATEYKEGTVIYPIPPQGCSQGFCTKVAEAIRSCGSDAVLEVLQDSEEICFTTVPTLGEDEKAHLFGGIMPDQDCQCDEYGYSAPVQGESLWSSCIRKLNKIFTLVGGRSLCMPEAPEYDPDLDTENLAREAIFDKKGCLRKGGAVGDCRNATEITGEETGADAVIVCKDSQRRILVPSCDTIIVGCCTDGEDPKWVVKDKGLSLFMLDEPIVLHSNSWPTFGSSSVPSASSFPATILETVSLDEDLFPDYCGKIYALVDFQSRITDTGSSNVLTTDISYNGEYYRKLIAGQTNDVFNTHFTDIVPLDADNPGSFIFKWDKLAGTGTYRSNVRILGYYA